MLRREVLDAQFAGLKQALSGQDPEAMNQVKDMLADLNALLAAHARGEDTTDGSASSWTGTATSSRSSPRMSTSSSTPSRAGRQQPPG